MELNIASVEIEPKRHTFGHIARRFGEDRPASRYEEATYDGQATENFHYRPLWEPEYEIYDVKRTKIVMSDWYKLLDPRKFHYMTYVATRSKQNLAHQQSFDFAENSGIATRISEETKEKIYKYITPLRHYEYGVNLNNLTIVARGYGTAFTAATLFYGTDSLGMAQHITKITLAICDNDTAILDKGKASWIEDENWQPLRELMENLFVLKDPVELLIAQNVVLDGIVLPLLVRDFPDEVAQSGDYTLKMLLAFINEWQEETIKWLDSIVKVMADESEDNCKYLSEWSKKYIVEAKKALNPLSKFSSNDSLLTNIITTLEDRLRKLGLNI